MSIAVKSPSADFSHNPGHSTSLFVAQSDLLMAYDFSNQPASNPTAWKTGLVGSQSITAKIIDHVAHTITNSDTGWSQSPNGLGIRVGANGLLDLGYSMPQFVNNDGVGRTFIALAGTTDYTTLTTAAFLNINWVFGTIGLALGLTTTATPNNQLGSIIGKSTINEYISLILGAGFANMVVLRADGADNWLTDIPNVRAKSNGSTPLLNQTATALGIADPLQIGQAAGAAGPCFVGVNSSTASTAGAREQDVYAVAIWDRKLTDAEVTAQYERLRFRFKGVLI